jgi:nucleotide-binding universal stress UspA family protein
MSKEETVRETVGPSWLKQVVVAADASPASNEGLNLAADIARRTGTRLAVVHVRHALAGSLIGPGLAIGVISETLDELEVLTRAAATEQLEGTRIDWELVVRTGSPGEEILSFAESVDADMIVVGSNRHSSIHNLVLGSTSEYLRSHSRSAVLVVRPRIATDGEGDRAGASEDQTPGGRVEPARERPAPATRIEAYPQGVQS